MIVFAVLRLLSKYAFADFLVQLGEGRVATNPDGTFDVLFDDRCITTEDIINSIFKDPHNNIGNLNYFYKRAIICHCNTDNDAVNNGIFSFFSFFSYLL